MGPDLVNLADSAIETHQRIVEGRAAGFEGTPGGTLEALFHAHLAAAIIAFRKVPLKVNIIYG